MSKTAKQKAGLKKPVGTDKPIAKPRGGLAAEALAAKAGTKPQADKKDAPETKPRVRKASGESTPVSYKGRSEFIVELKASGITFKQAMEKIKEKYPGSSECNCGKVWNRPAKVKKETKSTS